MTPEIETQLLRAVVGVEAGASRGTGWVALDNGLIVTNAHVVGYVPEVSVRTFAPIDTIPARVIAVDVGLDVAVIMPKRRLAVSPLSRGDSRGVRVGQAVLAVGHPFGLALSITRGVLSATSRRIGDREYLQTDAAINPGNSGGPLVDEDARVLGVNTWIVAKANNLGFAVPVHAFQELLEELSGDVTRLRDRLPEYLCPACGTAFTRQDDHCPGCGDLLPHREEESLFDARERSRAGYLVVALLRRMGVDPVGARVDSRRWRISDARGDVLLTLSNDGELLRFQAPLSRVPRHAHEAAYRFLLTYSGASAAHVGPAITRAGVVELSFTETTSFLARDEVAHKVSQLRDEAERLRPILVTHFGAPAIEHLPDEGFVS